MMAACTNECLQNDTQYNQTLYNWSLQDLECDLGSIAEDFTESPLFQICVYLMYSAVFIVALLGNGLVCFVVYNTPQMKTVTNFFIVNLAVGDIFMTLCCVPFTFVPTLVLRYWPFGEVMCKVVNYSQTVSVLVSAYTLLAISIDRYMVIMHPLKPRLGKAATKMIIAAVWTGALATAIPIPIVSQLSRPSQWHEVCQVDICSEQWSSLKQSEQYTCALLTLQFALPLTALICTYTRIAHVVWWGRPPGEAQTDRDSRMQHSKRKMIKMMVTVVVVFTVCWLPLNVFIVLWTIHESNDEFTSWPGMPYVYFASHWLAMSHCCYNPIIYCYMNNKYRKGFKQVLSSWFCLKLNDPSRLCQRSSDCEGVGVALPGNGAAIGTKTQANNQNRKKFQCWRRNHNEIQNSTSIITGMESATIDGIELTTVSEPDRTPELDTDQDSELNTNPETHAEVESTPVIELEPVPERELQTESAVPSERALQALSSALTTRQSDESPGFLCVFLHLR